MGAMTPSPLMRGTSPVTTVRESWLRPWNCQCDSDAANAHSSDRPACCIYCHGAGIPLECPALTVNVLRLFDVTEHPNAIGRVVYRNKVTGSVFHDGFMHLPMGWSFPPPPGYPTVGVAMFDPIFPNAAPSWSDITQEITGLLSSLNANFKVIAMPYNGEVSWGVYLDCKKGRFQISGEGKSIAEAFKTFDPKFRDVLKTYYPAP